MYAPIPQQSGCSPWGCAVVIIVLLAAFIFLSIVTLILVVVGVIIYLIIQWLFSPQERLFGAWPMSRWTSGYEQGLFWLEKLTGFEAATTPMRILGGSLIISIVPLLFTGWILSFLNSTWLWVMPGVGLFLGFATAMWLSRVPSDWFWGSSGNIELGTGSLEELQEGIILGESGWLGDDEW